MWKVEIEPRAPVARCYKCGSSHVSALCHHCWRVGCAEHVRPSPRWAEKLFGHEGGGPGLENVRACHCGECARARAGTAVTTSRWLAVGVAGAVMAVVGVAAVWLSMLGGMAFLLVGGITTAGAMLRVRRCAARARADMRVPLHPKVADVELIEQLRGEITLAGDSAEYRTILEPVKGTISMLLTFGRPDRDRVWPRRWRKHAQDVEVRFCAGRILLQGQFGISAGEEIHGPVLTLASGFRLG